MQFLGLYKKIRNFDSNCTFKPQISKVTEELALQRRKRMLGDNVDVVDVLLC